MSFVVEYSAVILKNQLLTSTGFFFLRISVWAQTSEAKQMIGLTHVKRS
jgi:hypothetical protein